MRRRSFDGIRSKNFILLIFFETLIVFSVLLGVILSVSFDWSDWLSVDSFFATNHTNATHYIFFALPLLITAVAVWRGSRGLLYILAFIKFFLFSFAMCSLWVSFPNSGWLVAYLILLPDWVLLNTYHWFWLRCCVFQSLRINTDFVICSCFLVFTILIDRFLLSPFTASLFTIK